MEQNREAVQVPPNLAYDKVINRIQELVNLTNDSQLIVDRLNNETIPIQREIEALSVEYWKRLNQEEILSELEKCFGDNFWGIGRCFQLINDVVNNKTKLSNDEVVQAFKDWIPSEENEQCGQERALATTGDVQEAESGNNGKTESTTHIGEEEEIYMDVTMEEQVPASESDDEVFPNPTPAKVESKPRLLLCDDYIRGTLDAESVKSKTGGRRKRFSDKSVLVTSEKEAHIFTPKTVPREKSKLKYTEPHFIEPKKRRKN